MSTLRRILYGDVGISNLISGIISIFISLALIIWAYSYISGLSGGEDVVIKAEGAVIFAYFGIAIFLFAVWGGVEIGRFLQTELTKRRENA